MLIFVQDSRNRVLFPTLREDWANKLVVRGRARWSRKKIVILKLNYPVTSVTRDINSYFSIGIDSGYGNIGFCILKVSGDKVQKLFSGEVSLRTAQIKELLLERKMYRQGRRRCRRSRTNSLKFRHPRWYNRRNKERLNPTLRHIIQSHENILKFIFKLIPRDNSRVNLEYAKFDLQKLTGNRNLPGYGLNSKSMVLSRDSYTCQYCSATKVPLEVHHMVPRSQGGTDVPSNLITLCSTCHAKHHRGKINANISVNNKLRSSTINGAMPYIYKSIASEIPTYNYFGYETKEIARQYGIEKSHENDALILSFYNQIGTSIEYRDFKISLDIQQIRRHPSRAKTSRLENRKYVRLGANSTRSEAWALNKNKRSGQSDKSLADLKRLAKLVPNYQIKLSAIPAKKLWRTSPEFNPGELVQNTSTKEIFIVKGIGAGYKVYGFHNQTSQRQNPKTKRKQTATVKLKGNSGLCVI